jgi:hypothetical protein
MKLRLCATVALFLGTYSSFSQKQTYVPNHPPVPKFSVTLFGGYTFQDKVNLGYTYGYIRNAAHYGTSFEFMFNRLRSLELSYQRMDTKMPIYDGYTGILLNRGHGNGALNYIMIGGVNYFPFSPYVMPYGGLNLGVCVLTNKEDYTTTKFALGAKLGVKIKASQVVSVKIQTQLMSVVQGAGGSLYFGTGGPGYGVSTYSSVTQFGFTGGLSFDF